MKKIHSLLILAAAFITLTATAQVYPYVETFENYTPYTALNGNGGIVSTSHIQVYGARGLNASQCAEFQMTPFASPHYDTMTGPLIGPLTANSVASFYFRVVTYTGGTPFSYPMTSTDKVELILGNANFSVSSSLYTITSANQNTTGAYVMLSLPVSSFAGVSGKYRFIASNPSANDWIFELDSVVVSDANAASALTLTDLVTNAKCYRQASGAIHVSASGGTGPYTYHWSTGSTLDSITAIAGIYTVTVTDHNGATAVLTDSILQPNALVIDSISTIAPQCFGQQNGSATAYVSGGTGAYHYAWTTGSSTQSIINLAAGSYAVTTTDDNGCSASLSKNLFDPTLLAASVSTTATTGVNGTATVTASGGSPGYTYIWNNAQTTATATGLAAGIYNVTITDQNGCSLTASATIVPSGIADVNEMTMAIYPNPATDRLYLSLSSQEMGKAELSIYDINGRLLSQQHIHDYSIDVSALSNGSYIAKIETALHQYRARFTIAR